MITIFHAVPDSGRHTGGEAMPAIGRLALSGLIAAAGLVRVAIRPVIR